MAAIGSQINGTLVLKTLAVQFETNLTDGIDAGFDEADGHEQRCRG